MKTLAWHETLELHEILAASTYYLFKLKSHSKHITDKELKELYIASIGKLEEHVRDLLKFMSNITIGERDTEYQYASEMAAEDLLSASKILIKMYAHAITETATSELREIFVKHLLSVIDWHTKIFNFLAKKGQYSAYKINDLIQNDVKKAIDVLNMPS